MFTVFLEKTLYKISVLTLEHVLKYLPHFGSTTQPVFT